MKITREPPQRFGGSAPAPLATLWWVISMGLSFLLGIYYSDVFLSNMSLEVKTDAVAGVPPEVKTKEGHLEDANAVASAPRRLLDLPNTVKYVYINIGTSWDPWPGCGTKGTSAEVKNGHNYGGGGLPYDPEVFCIYVEPLMRVNEALYERGLVTNSSILIHTAIGPSKGLAPFYEYAGVSGVASSLSVIADEILEKEIAGGGKGPFSAGSRGQTFTTVVTLKDLLDIIPDHVRILQMKTDMQGYDVTAMKSAGGDIQRIDEIFHECYGDGETVEYKGAPIPNTYKAAKALLEPLGFESGVFKSHDCNWRRKGNVRLPGARYIGDFE